jgi:hypothetical protein
VVQWPEGRTEDGLRFNGGVPAFVGTGNQAIHRDPGITLSKQWMRESRGEGVVEHRATEATRGTESSRWCVEKILARGYALATVYYGDLERVRWKGVVHRVCGG